MTSASAYKVARFLARGAIHCLLCSASWDVADSELQSDVFVIIVEQTNSPSLILASIRSACRMSDTDNKTEKENVVKVEQAATGRSTCRATGEKIEKGEWRAGMEAWVAGRVNMTWQV